MKLNQTYAALRESPRRLSGSDTCEEVKPPEREGWRPRRTHHAPLTGFQVMLLHLSVQSE